MHNFRHHSQRATLIVAAILLSLSAKGQVAGALRSYNDGRAGLQRQQQYLPSGSDFVCVNGTNRFTRALYGGPTEWRLETSDRPVFALYKNRRESRNVRFRLLGDNWQVALDSTDYCEARYGEARRSYVLRDSRFGPTGQVELTVVATPDGDEALWRFVATGFGSQSPALRLQAVVSAITARNFSRNGDIGADKPGGFEAQQQLHTSLYTLADTTICRARSLDLLPPATDDAATFRQALQAGRQLASRLSFVTPDAYINTLGGALAVAADGDWDGTTFLHGCIGWRMPLAGWRAAYAGDVLGWGDRARRHFTAYARSQVTSVPPTKPHPTQDPKQQMARAEKAWGTQMYSDGYICRNPERNNQMHHYDMNLNYIDELLWHFQYDADTAYMRQLWPTIKRHLAWEKRNFDPDGDHLYDAYCCIWASDALYYSGGAVTHSSAYNYRGHLLAARIASLLGDDPKPYATEAAAILQAMNRRLWLPATPSMPGHWAEYEEGLGLRRLHGSAAVWSVYTPIDCGACSAEQAWQATDYVTTHIPHIPIESPAPLPATVPGGFADGSAPAATVPGGFAAGSASSAAPAPDSGYATISTSDWMPYSWSINNVAPAEVMHTALAYFEAGRADEGFRLLKSSVLDNMYFGQSPANFGQLSHYDAARGECYRDFGDVIGIASRALVQGLFGIVPQALYGRCIIRPAFPADWDSVSVSTPYLNYTYVRSADGTARLSVSQHFAQPLTIVVRQNLGQGRYTDIVGSADGSQVITWQLPASTAASVVATAAPVVATVPSGFATGEAPSAAKALSPSALGLDEPDLTRPFRRIDIRRAMNASVSDIFRNSYTSPRPSVTTLQIPLQGVGEWCHPLYTPTISDSVLRATIANGEYSVAGVPFLMPSVGNNIVYTSLWDNYPDSITLPLRGKASSAYLLMAGSTNHMQSRIDNGLVVATYSDGSTDTLRLRNPDNWCPIEQDYYVDHRAFTTIAPRPYRLCLGNGVVSRNLGEALHIDGVYGREIPGGAAQMLRMPLQADKKLRSLTVRTLSPDVVIGLMGVTLQ